MIPFLEVPKKGCMAMAKQKGPIPLLNFGNRGGEGFQCWSELCVGVGYCRLSRCGAYHWIYQLLEPLSAVSRMVALVSHDLRHPLTAILANAEFLTQPDISEMERNELYHEIRCAIDRMNELVSSLLECSRGRDTLRPGHTKHR